MAIEPGTLDVVKRILLLLMAALSVFAQAAGTYTGTWSSGTAGTGKLTLNFTGGKLSSATFTIRGTNIDAKPVLSKLDKNSYSFTFAFEIDGNPLRSSMIGTLAEGSMKGSYRTQTESRGEPVDEGTWEVTQQ